MLELTIDNFANVGGKQNLIAGTDCGFTQILGLCPWTIERVVGQAARRSSMARGWQAPSFGVSQRAGYLSKTSN